MKRITILSCILLLLSCGENEITKVKQADVVLMPVHLMDSIQHFFGNENWRVVNGKDTFYHYFSRQNDLLLNVYQFKMNKGDSVHSSLQTIYCTPKGIFWQQAADTFQLRSATQHTMSWVHGTNTLNFTLLQPAMLQQQYQNTVSIMQPTINLTDFLIRSRYDFLHGTHYASDTAKFKRGVSKQLK
ncbi:hypothetical protein [Hydrotalea flava]|uniref:hypothetical protein n=1 Tax=Hydrotalea flava TaxID=714549 RepID=UPI00142EFDB6|nr:hypothetical protein [Hydrotalea flava]